MKRRTIIFLIALAASMQLNAQSGLQIGKLFDGRYRNRSDATEVIMKGKKVSGYGLTLFRSLTLTPSQQDMSVIEQAVRSDAAHATDREVGMKGGRLYYGFYRLQPHGKQNRYLFYRNNALKSGGTNTLTLIYMEGDATIEELKRTFAK